MEFHILKDTTLRITCWMWPAIRLPTCSRVGLLRVHGCGALKMRMARWKRGTLHLILGFGIRQVVPRTPQLS